MIKVIEIFHRCFLASTYTFFYIAHYSKNVKLCEYSFTHNFIAPNNNYKTSVASTTPGKLHVANRVSILYGCSILGHLSHLITQQM